MSITGLHLGLAIGVSLAAGAFGGYKYAQKKLAPAIWEEAMNAAKEESDYTISRAIAVEKVKLSDEVVEYHEMVGDLNYAKEKVSEVSEEDQDLLAPEYRQTLEVGKSMVDSYLARNDDTMEYEESEYLELTLPEEVLAERTGKIYLITKDEFFEEDEGHLEKISLVYYEGDKTLADFDDSYIPDIKGTVGHANLLRFGLGSDEDHIVYVRNDQLHVDYEIVREEGSYKDLLLGVQAELMGEREARSRPKKFRDDA